MSNGSVSSSGSYTPDSLRSYSRGLDSNSTPSPTGKRSPLTDPHALSGKLALLEASESLSQAAATLSVAAQAISKAAKSLSYLAEEGSFQTECSLSDSFCVTSEHNSPWQQPEYRLHIAHDTSDSSDHRELKGAPKNEEGLEEEPEHMR